MAGLLLPGRGVPPSLLNRRGSSIGQPPPTHRSPVTPPQAPCPCHLFEEELNRGNMWGPVFGPPGLSARPPPCPSDTVRVSTLFFTRVAWATRLLVSSAVDLALLPFFRLECFLARGHPSGVGQS